MQAFFLCWMFDKRWLCSLANPCLEFLLIVPLVVNLVTIGGVLYERGRAKAQVDSIFIILITIYTLLTGLCLLLLTRTYLQSEQKLRDARENYEAIRIFIHTFEAKKGVWGWMGFCTAVLSAIQMAVNHYYMELQGTAPCLTNQTRWYIDVAAWIYIGLVVLFFLLCKLTFLFMAWRNPEKYLTYKQVI